MSGWQIAAGVALFALATAVLYVWGLRKSMNQADDLTRILLNRCGSRVVRYLKKHGTISAPQAAEAIRGVTAGEFWSRKRLMVQEPEKFAGEVLTYLEEQQYIQRDGRGGWQLKK